MTPPVSAHAATPARWSIGRMLLASLVLLAVAGTGPALAQVPVRFSLDWRFDGTAAPFLMALEKGYFKAEGLDVTLEPGNGSRETVTRVASGAYDAGAGDVNSLIRYRDDNPGIDVKAVMILHDRPPFAIVGRKSRGISADIKSVEGKRIGAPAADAAFAQWPVFKAVTGVDDSKMRLENVGFPVREPMLASGEVDAVFGYANSSYINLKARGVPADDIVVMLMADYGIELYGNGVMVSPKFLAEKPEAVRGLVRAITRGMKDTVADPDFGAQLAVRRNDAARIEVETERLKMMLQSNVMTAYVKANGFGGIDAARWERALDQIGMGLPLKDRARAGAAFTDRFLPAANERVF